MDAAGGGCTLESGCLCANVLCAFVWVSGLWALVPRICGHARTNECREAAFMGLGGGGAESCVSADIKVSAGVVRPQTAV